MDRPEGVVDFTPDPGLFPFESRWFESSVGPLHYIDEGDGRPILFLHGNPDWSFLYRKIVAGLKDQFRCVAVDYPGFGLSVHPDGYGYSAAEHAGVVGELVDQLDLRDFIVMGQDWGGPIGMEVASRRADRVYGLVMGNTWYWEDKARQTWLFSRTMGSPPLQWLITRRNFFVNTLMKRTLRVKLSNLEFAHYQDVVPTPESRAGIAEFPKQILKAHPWLRELDARVGETLRDKRVLLTFGMKDAFLSRDAVIKRWQADFPQARLVEIAEAGHFFQEDAPEAVAQAIRDEFGGSAG